MLIVAYAPTAAAQEPPKNLTPEAEGRDGPGQGETDAPAPTGLRVTSSTANSVSLRWYSVTNAYRYKLERSTTSSGPWTDVGSETSGTSRSATGLECSTTYYFRVSARGDGSPYSTTFGSASSSVSRATSACAPTIGVDVQSPFVGQAVTMTVSTTGSSGTVSSYQWQEWSAGSWTDLGLTTTSATRSESSSVAGYRSFRVVVAYTSGTPVESYAVTIEWKAMTVTVTSTPEFPQSGPAATSTVTLTAGGDVPSGAVYQWQQATSSGWTDLGATSTSATKDVWSAARGTRKFRVEVRYAGMTVQSEPTHVTWDEWDIVAEMIGELSAAVATSTDYTNAQTSLLSCMNATSTTSTGSGPKSPSDSRAPTMPPAVTFATFDDVLASYTGDVKARMEAGGDCAATSTTMFTRNESVARAELARLKAGNVVYAGLLDTPHGRQFEANLADPDDLKLVSYLGATTFEPGEFTAPLYAPSDDGGAVGKSDTTPPAIIPALGTGLDCLPSGVIGANLTLRNKLVVLNCLVFSTPHSFWVGSPDGLGDVESLRTGPQAGRWDWLAFGDWVCTSFLQGPVPSCLKHDVAWGSLKKFVSNTDDDDVRVEDDDTLDEAWNPRNKSLADARFKADIARHGCQNSDFWARLSVCPPVNLLGLATNHSLSELYFLGVANINSKSWVYTDYDSEHIDSNPRLAVHQIPSVSNVRVSSSQSDLPDATTYRVSWTYNPGSLRTATVSSYRLCWETDRGRRICRYANGDVLSYDLVLPVELVAFKLMAISPNRIRFLGLGGIYYPPQSFDLRYGE